MISTHFLSDRLGPRIAAAQRRGRRTDVAGSLAAAVENAFGRFLVCHTDWANSLFDRHFLQWHATDILVGLIAGELELREAREQLVAAWDRQFGGGDSERRQKRRIDLIPAVDRFIAWFVDESVEMGEVGQSTARRPIVCSGVLDEG